MNQDSVISQLQSLGLVITGPLEIGKLVRVAVEDDSKGKKSGWYSLFEFRLDSGEFAISGAFGNWKTGEQQKVSLKGIKVDPEERRRINEQIKKSREEQQAERAKLARRAAKWAHRSFSRLSLTGSSPYLDRKRVKGYGVRYDQKGILYIPLMDVHDGIQGLQLIYPDKQAHLGGRDKTFWPTGLAKEGHFYRIGPTPEPTSPIVIAEGYATGASVFAATGFTVFIAFDAGNLEPVAVALRGVYPRNPFIFAADDDFETTNAKGEPWNPGIERATAAAKRCRGYVAHPDFKNPARRGTDFNDLHVIEGLDAVRTQILGVLPPSEQMDWRSRLVRTRNGELKADVSNVNTVLMYDSAWQEVLGYCDFSYRVVKRKKPPFRDGEAGEWTDSDTARLRIWMSEKHGFTPKAADAHDAVVVVAQANRFHPVREYLNSLQWDGVPRLSSWMTMYLGAEPTDYVEAVSVKWMIAAVARVMEPPAKADCVLILEGLQGLGKSTALSILGHPWFSDSPFSLGDKDGYAQMQGVWIMELAELDSFNKAESTRAKQFFGSKEDRYRPSYGRIAETFPRQCVFAGSTNQDSYLKDATGNRRYWPVACRFIEAQALQRDRDQLWAEALVRYRERVPWWPLPEEKHLFEAEQEDRFDNDVWEDAITDWLNDPENVGKRYVRLVDLFAGALKMEAAQMKPPEQKRVVQILTRLGWKKSRPNLTLPNGKKKKTWVYERPQSGAPGVHLPYAGPTGPSATF